MQGKEVIQNIQSRARYANSNVYFKENPSGKSFIHSFYLCDLNVDHVSFNIDLLLDMREVKTAWDLGKC